ncbi:MAG: hypothetical protein LOD90_06430, partial [Symbiobacteriaceae bacterium]
VLPEYNGALLAFIDPKSTAATTEEVNAELAEKLPAEVELLDSAPAEDKDSLTVTEETAAEYGLRTIEDLAKVSKDFVVGGPPEFLRPPLGRFDRQLTRLAEEEGLKLVLWSNAVAPPGADSPSHLAAQVLRALRPGAVLMIPLEAPEGTEAARLVLEGLAEAGYRAVALSAELVDAN